MRIKCCEHNPCPDRPTGNRKLRRYHTTPWACPQCGTCWVTQSSYGWGEYAGESWKKIDTVEVVYTKDGTVDKIFEARQ